jgi:hypothetical protein
MCNFATVRTVVPFAIALLGCVVTPSFAADRFESGDNSFATAPTLLPFGGPQNHDLESFGGTPDTDWFSVEVRPIRSYEIRLSSPTGYNTITELSRRDIAHNVVQSGADIWGPFSGRTQHTFLRWEVGNVHSDAETRTWVTVSGSGGATANDQYDIEFLDTTLFCPRYNNTGSQASVLMLQAAPEDQNSCNYTVWFFNEAGALVGPAAGTQGTLGESDMQALATSTVPGVSNTRGSIRVTHDCGYRNIVGKLVALEPSTGYSFDTACVSK